PALSAELHKGRRRPWRTWSGRRRPGWRRRKPAHSNSRTGDVSAGEVRRIWSRGGRSIDGCRKPREGHGVLGSGVQHAGHRRSGIKKVSTQFAKSLADGLRSWKPVASLVRCIFAKEYLKVFRFVGDRPGAAPNEVGFGPHLAIDGTRRQHGNGGRTASRVTR